MIWVEILSRQRDVLTRHRIAGDTLRIGRGYGNDLVLDDPHVAAEHLSIWRDAEGRLIAEDLGSANGLVLDGRKGREPWVVIDGDVPLRIGQTLLRIRDDSYVVAAERPLVDRRPRWPVLALLSFVIIAIELIGAWRGDYHEFKAATYIQPVLTVVMIVGIWVGAWTLLSRLLARAARFETHLTIGLAAMLTVSLANEIADFGAFALSWAWLVNWRFAIGYIVVGAAGFLHMRALGPARLKLKLAGALAVPVLLIGYHTVIDADQQRNRDLPVFVHLLFPPGFRVSPLKSEADFFDALTKMRADLEHERASAAQ